MIKFKMHGNKLIKVALVIMFCLISIFYANDVSAKKCTSDNFSASDNGSIHYACEMVRQGRSVRYGAMWISDDPSSSSIRDEVDITATSGKVKIYLHGLAICSGSGCIGHVKATYIKLIQSNRSSAICDSAYSNYSTWDALSSVPSSLNRPVIGRNTTFTSAVDSMYLDVDKLKSSNFSYTVVGGKRQYNIPIHPYRCMAGFKPSTSSYCNCGSDDDPIYVKIKIPDSPSFSGRTRVSGANDTDYTKTSKDAGTYYIDNCSPVDGCKVTFKHSMKRTIGTGPTTYSVNRTSNYSKMGVTTTTLESNKTFNSDVAEVKTDNVTLYPGQVVCEILTFDNNGSGDGGAGIKTKVCASALGNAQPPDGNQAFINILVKNIYASSTYHTYQRTVYAKPGDKVSWYSSYNPILQYTAYLSPEKMRINSGRIYEGSGNLLNMFNAKRGSLREWNNAYSVQVGRGGSYSGKINNYKKNVGDTSLETHEDNEVTLVGEGDVGKTINGRAITSLSTEPSTQTTPGQVTFTKNGNKNLGTVDTNSRSSVANVNVPYNFDSRIEVKRDESEPVYAGESNKISIDLDIIPRLNTETMKSGDPNYATRLGNAKYKIIVYRGAQKGGHSSWGSNNLCSYYGLPENETSCGYSEEASGPDVVSSINDGLTRLDGKHSSLERIFYTQDMKAGETVCVSAAFWPANSGAPTNMDKDGSKTWRISNSKCFKVAKRPSIQVWGGNVYSKGKIKTGTSLKHHLAGYTTYDVSAAGGTFVFGSWGELGVVANSSVSGFGSGASMGYARNDGGGITWPRYTYKVGSSTADYIGTGNTAAGGESGGSNKSSFCDRIPLTIPNVNCNGTATIGLNLIAGIDRIDNDKVSIIDLLNLEGETINNSNVSSETIGPINGGETRVIGLKDGDITIASDLIYFDNSDAYQSYRDMPKLIIYAKNIRIGCSVERIDALLIADNAVITCSDSIDRNVDLENQDAINDAVKATIDNRENSRQLFINGAIITDKLIANRTYGAATGANSIIPAEIINFDPTLYKFSNSAEADNDVTRRLDIESMNELPPRL